MSIDQLTTTLGNRIPPDIEAELKRQIPTTGRDWRKPRGKALKRRLSIGGDQPK